MTKPIFAGVDVGGTNTKVGILTDDGQILGNSHFPTDQARGAEHALRLASQTVETLIAENGVDPAQLIAVG